MQKISRETVNMNIDHFKNRPVEDMSDYNNPNVNPDIDPNEIRMMEDVERSLGALLDNYETFPMPEPVEEEFGSETSAYEELARAFDFKTSPVSKKKKSPKKKRKKEDSNAHKIKLVEVDDNDETDEFVESVRKSAVEDEIMADDNFGEKIERVTAYEIDEQADNTEADEEIVEEIEESVEIEEKEESEQYEEPRKPSKAVSVYVEDEEAYEVDEEPKAKKKKPFENETHKKKAHEKKSEGYSYEDDDSSIAGFKGIMIAIIAVFVITAAYVSCCFATGGSKVLGHTYVGDEDLIGMSRGTAQKTVSDIYTNTFKDSKLKVEINGITYEIPVFSAMISPVEDIAKEAVTFGHGFFLSRGVSFIESKLSKRNLDILPTEIDDVRLGDAIAASHIVEDNSGSSANWRILDDNLIITKSSVKREIDKENLEVAMKEAILSGDFDTVIECPFAEIPADNTDLQAIYEDMHTDPRNATLDPENDYSIVDSVDGLSFDLEEAENMLASATDGETVSIPLVHTLADVTAEDLEENMFRETMGSYTTTVRGTADRRSNVRLAASKCEKIMLPGDVFSYNETVGKRTEEAGFKKAAAYSNGDTVQELGGGICQASSTLYNAVVIANLEITERHNHSFASSYVPLGQDATVSWGGPDFKFTNNTSYPIKIEQIYEDDKLTFNIIGTNISGEYCELTNETLSTNPFAVVEQASPDLYVGETKRSVEGETGYRVKTYRHLYSADGTEISVTEEDTSNYLRRDEVRLVGTKLPDDIMSALISQMNGGIIDATVNNEGD